MTFIITFNDYFLQIPIYLEIQKQTLFFKSSTNSRALKVSSKVIINNNKHKIWELVINFIYKSNLLT